MSPGPVVGLRPGDLDQLERLLDENGLPFEDCAGQLSIFHGVHDNGELIAAGGLEPAGQYALLRSIVVQDRYRGAGLAKAITQQLLRQARIESRVAVFLLTETADAYFSRLGFERVARETVPSEIARTRQFASLCPDSAVCMRIDLSQPG